MAQVTVKGEFAELAKLFVEPTHLRSGAGTILFRWAIAVAHRCGAASMVIGADPSAVGFYRRMGAVDDGRTTARRDPTPPSRGAPARVTADMAGPVALGDEGPVVADGEHLAAAGQRVDEPVRLRLEVSKTPFEKPFQPARLKR